MRVAPIGLYFNDRRMDIEKIDRIGAEAAAITHGHELGYIPAAALVHIIHRLSQDDMAIDEAIQDSIEAAKAMWPKATSIHFIRLLVAPTLLYYIAEL